MLYTSIIRTVEYFDAVSSLDLLIIRVKNWITF